jgi:hypothetical protein
LGDFVSFAAMTAIAATTADTFGFDATTDWMVGNSKVATVISSVP